jgi:pimeloyl-ACP methyl ester carboxylesterase
MRPSRSEFVPLRGHRYHVRIWDDEGSTAWAHRPTLFFLHGWGDVGASFQFVVDALPRGWRVIAPDWRGFGLSQWNDGPYWFLDYIADLDALLEIYSPEQPALIAGHSMGGIVASLYAGIRPQRVARLANLEGFALWVSAESETPARLEKWLQQIHADDPAFRSYASRADFAARLQSDNPRLPAARAAFLAEHSLRAAGDGRNGNFVFAADPRHRWINPLLFPLAEAKACWRCITAPTLWLAGKDSAVMKAFAEHADDYRERLACFADAREILLDDCGHNHHHDQPETLAQLLDEFLA